MFSSVLKALRQIQGHAHFPSDVNQIEEAFSRDPEY